MTVKHLYVYEDRRICMSLKYIQCRATTRAYSLASKWGKSLKKKKKEKVVVNGQEHDHIINRNVYYTHGDR